MSGSFGLFPVRFMLPGLEDFSSWLLYFELLGGPTRARVIEDSELPTLCPWIHPRESGFPTGVVGDGMSADSDGNWRGPGGSLS